MSRLELSDGIGGTRATTYSYAGAKSDLHGRGFLGFREMTAQDLQTNIVQRSSYYQYFPYTLLKQGDSRILDGVTLSSVTNSYGSTALGGTRHRVFLTESVSERTDLDGTAFPIVTTAYQYDAYGNATEVTVSTSDGHTKTTTNTYSNDTTNWLLGRLTGATVTSQTP